MLWRDLYRELSKYRIYREKLWRYKIIEGKFNGVGNIEINWNYRATNHSNEWNTGRLRLQWRGYGILKHQPLPATILRGVTYRNLSERCHEVRPKHFGIYINQSALTDWFDSIVPPQHLWLDPPVTGTLSRRRKNGVHFIFVKLTDACVYIFSYSKTYK